MLKSSKTIRSPKNAIFLFGIIGEGLRSVSKKREKRKGREREGKEGKGGEAGKGKG